MELTTEQQLIIQSTGNIKINAVAGSGKTTTVIAYAETRPQSSRILYLAFNKSVKLEAIKKFAEKGLTNVTVETAHSLANKYIVRSHGYKVRKNDLKTAEIVDILGLEGNGERFNQFIIANHINKFLAYYCNSDKKKVQDLNYLDVVHENKAKVFVQNFYSQIEEKVIAIIKRMDNGEIEITHDFYLKTFQLSNPELPYDYILLDEGQDSTPALLDIFLKQKCTKVIVGDTFQQIYGWRFAINSLEKIDFKDFKLSTSFRFNQTIAHLANNILKWKSYIGIEKPIEIIGKGGNQLEKTKAVLARTNLGLLYLAIEYVVEKKRMEEKKIYFEGKISSYTFADDGASLYDVLNLFEGKRNSIKDKVIASMRDMEELEDYIEKTEDVQLSIMVEIVNKYGNKIYEIIKTLKEKHIDDNCKDDADVIFSTIHRCKGMEYDNIHLAKDFINEEKLKKLTDDKESEINKQKLNEEINLLYVAITRTRNIINIPENLIPSGVIPSNQIRLIKVNKEENQTNENIAVVTNAHQPWTVSLDDELTIMYCEEKSTKRIANHFGRTENAIKARIIKLELSEKYG